MHDLYIRFSGKILAESGIGLINFKYNLLRYIILQKKEC